MISGLTKEAAGASPAERATVRSAGLHLGALQVLGPNYTDREYIQAITAAEQAGVGEAYETAVLGVVEEETGDLGVAIHERAMRILAARGITDPDYRQYANALAEVGS
jgi:hypothetical protein